MQTDTCVLNNKGDMLDAGVLCFWTDKPRERVFVLKFLTVLKIDKMSGSGRKKMRLTTY